MNLRSVIWKAIDRVLAPLGYELRSRVPRGSPLTMQAALAPILAGAEATREAALLVLEENNFPLRARSLRFHEMCAHLDKLGFRCADMADVSLRPKDKLLWQADFFFPPKTSPFFSHSGYR